jgi:choline dehydrogenase
VSLYDAVIIGAGSAGAVLAARLSEDPGRQVLLLEAGGPNRNPLISIPLASIVKLFGDERYFWRYDGQSERGVGNRPQTVMHGKGLGGSSSVNGMVFVRGHPGDYDEWAALGAGGWSYSDVLPYFMRLESCALGDPAVRGKSGPISARSGFSDNPLFDVFIAAAQEAGHPLTSDYNGVLQWGVARTQHAITEGRARRSSPLASYLRPAMKRSNLCVVTRATVTRIVIENGRAVGVEYLLDGQRHRADTAGEVILSAGSYKSPQVLMHSGIGPPDHLREMGIDPAVALSGVGKNLQDHLGSFVQHGCSRPVSIMKGIGLPGRIGASFRYLLRGDGLLSHYPAEGIAHLKSDPDLERPDLQFYMAPFLRVPASSSVPSATVVARHGYCVSWCLLRPASRGSVTLASSDPLAPPRVVHNYLEAEEDRACHRRAVAMAREIHASPAFDPYREEEIDPGADCVSADNIDGYIRQTCHTHLHPAGTCAMGTDNDAVVDADLRVHGVDGLRVVDASVMPRLVGGNTNIPTIMLAEKASDMIRGLTPCHDALPAGRERTTT